MGSSSSAVSRVAAASCCAVEPDQRGQGRRPEQRGVARAARPRRRPRRGVARASRSGPRPWRRRCRAGRAARRTRCRGRPGRGRPASWSTHSPRWPTTTTTRLDVELGQRVEHVEHHRPAAQVVQGLGPVRAHPGALAGGEHDGGERSGRLMRPFFRRRGGPAGADACLGDRCRTTLRCATVTPRRLRRVRPTSTRTPRSSASPTTAPRPSAASPSRSSPGRALSALVWGTAPPELVLLHGGAQNAHTWDTVALALGRPLVAIDLPGPRPLRRRRGRARSRRADNAADVAAVVRAAGARGPGGGRHVPRRHHRPRPGRRRPRPGTPAGPGRHHPRGQRRKAAAITAFVDGPPDLRQLRRHPGPDGRAQPDPLGVLVAARASCTTPSSWTTAAGCGATPGSAPPSEPAGASGVRSTCGTAVSRLAMPVLLVRGMAPGSVVDDDDEAELLRRQPDAQVARVDGAGHSVQGDRPVELARLLDDFVPDPGRSGRPSEPGRTPGSLPGVARTRRRPATPTSGCTRRAVGLHLTLLVVVPAFSACSGGRSSGSARATALSWAYVFEWPFFTGYAVYLWWSLVHDQPEPELDPPRRGPRSRRRRDGGDDMATPARGRRRPPGRPARGRSPTVGATRRRAGGERGRPRAGRLQPLPGRTGRQRPEEAPVARAAVDGTAANQAARDARSASSPNGRRCYGQCAARPPD